MNDTILERKIKETTPEKDLNTGYGFALDDASALSELSDQTIEVDPDNIRDICTTWSNKVASANISSINVESAFQPLTNVGVATAYIPSLKNALEKVEGMLLSVSNYVKTAADEQEEVDTDSSNKEKKYSNRDSDGTGNRNNNNNHNNNNNNNGDPVSTEPPTVADTDVDNTKEDIDINTVMSDINKLTYESYLKFMTALGTITGGKLTEYLTTKEYAETLKNLILNSPEIPDSFKATVKDMNAVDVQTLLQQILSNKDNITDTNKNIIKNYVESKNGQAEITAAAKGKGFYDDVDVIYNEMNTIMSKDEKLSDLLLEVYDGGTDVSDETMDFLRASVDELAKENNMTYNELLSGTNEGLIRDKMESLSKSLSYLRTVSTLDSSISSQIYNVVIG